MEEEEVSTEFRISNYKESDDKFTKLNRTLYNLYVVMNDQTLLVDWEIWKEPLDFFWPVLRFPVIYYTINERNPLVTLTLLLEYKVHKHNTHLGPISPTGHLLVTDFMQMTENRRLWLNWCVGPHTSTCIKQFI